MDEPFSALDPLIREHLQNELLGLQKQLNKTIVFVSHDLDEAIKIGNRISIMQEGRIVQHDAPESIVLRPASDYVKQFVAHMNPVKVLRAASLMSAVGTLPNEGHFTQLDWTGHHLLQLDANGGPALVHIEGSPAQLFDVTGFDGDISACKDELITRGQEGRCMVMAHPSLLLRDIIFIRQATGRPVLIGEHGRCMGVVSDEEIYRSLLPQTQG
jgi:glycine betaine/proline transport system ATP-binding protein